jgi:hypothetical protein
MVWRGDAVLLVPKKAFKKDTDHVRQGVNFAKALFFKGS